MHFGIPEVVGDEMDSSVAGLELSADAEEGGGLGDGGVLPEHFFPQDEVHEPGLVLEGHEDHALGRAGPLAVDDHPRIVDEPSVRHPGEGGGVGQSHPAEFFPERPQGMAPHAVAAGVAIPGDGFEGA